MTKTELAARLHLETGCSRSNALQMINALAQIITEEVATGNVVQISGFGQFSAKPWPGRSACNPRTGVRVWLPAVVTPSFRAGAAFKAALQGGLELKQRNAHGKSKG